MNAALQLNPAPEFIPMPPDDQFIEQMQVVQAQVEQTVALPADQDPNYLNAYRADGIMEGYAVNAPGANITWNIVPATAETATNYYSTYQGWAYDTSVTTAATSTYTLTSGTGGAITYAMGSGGAMHVPLTTTAGTVTINAGGWYDAGNTVVYNADATNYTITVNGVGGISFAGAAPLTKAQKVKRAIQQRLTPAEHRHRIYLAALNTPQEQRARDSLRDIVTEAEWRRYVTNGFLMVKGPSNKFYQIFADRRHTQVFEKGKNIASLCIHSDQSCPPSDHVINLKLLVEMDEALVWQGSNVTWKDGRGNSTYQNLIVNGSGGYGQEPDYSKGNLVQLMAVKSA